jgi:hypothetical protein
MRSRRQPSQDSLELLLDTLCNVFGGIILITCLLALMNNKKSEGNQMPTSGKGSGQLIEQRLLSASSELERLKMLQIKLESADDAETRLLAAEHNDLQKTLERLRREKSDTTPSEIAPVLDPGEEVVKMRSKAEEAQAKLAEASSEESALKARATQITARIEEIQKMIGEKKKSQTQKLRFPKEGVNNKQPWFVAIKSGEVYPIYIPSGELFPGVTRKDIDSDRYSITLNSGGGWDMDQIQSQLAPLLGQIARSGGYVSMLIYGDDKSFDTFKSVKELIFSQGLKYGVEVLPSETPIFFTTKGGSSAPPL